MFFVDVMETTHHTALEQAEETFNCVRRGIAARVFACGVVDRFVATSELACAEVICPVLVRLVAAVGCALAARWKANHKSTW